VVFQTYQEECRTTIDSSYTEFQEIAVPTDFQLIIIVGCVFSAALLAGYDFIFSIGHQQGAFNDRKWPHAVGTPLLLKVWYSADSRRIKSPPLHECAMKGCEIQNHQLH
jgi:hypothetical protein